MKCFQALAFLPTEDVASVFEELIDDDCISTEFISYFEYTYIRIARERGNRRRRDNPLYPIETWNVRQRTLFRIAQDQQCRRRSSHAQRSQIICYMRASQFLEILAGDFSRRNFGSNKDLASSTRRSSQEEEKYEQVS